MALSKNPLIQDKLMNFICILFLFDGNNQDEPVRSFQQYCYKTLASSPTHEVDEMVRDWKERQLALADVLSKLLINDVKQQL